MTGRPTRADTGPTGLARGDVPRAVMHMGWRLLTYAHWAVDPDRVAARLPEGLEVDTHGGRAWVGLIPFEMRDVRLPGMPEGIPWLGTFPETNVRTYVRGPEGRRGVYFLSLDASRAGAVAVARATYDLPYFWSRMRIRPRAGGGLSYTTRRRAPGPRGVTSHVAVEVGRRVAPTDLDRFLAERYGLFVPARDGSLRHAAVSHEPWPLFDARVTRLRDRLVAAAGFEDLAGNPPDHVRFSPGVDVRVGPPRKV